MATIVRLVLAVPTAQALVVLLTALPGAALNLPTLVNLVNLVNLGEPISPRIVAGPRPNLE